MSKVTRRGAYMAAVLFAGLLGLYGYVQAAAAAAPAPPPREDSQAWPVLRIPGDYPLPRGGERVTVPVPVGAEIQLVGEAADPGGWLPAVEGADLLLQRSTGGTLVLKDFFSFEARPATLSLADGVVLTAPDLLDSLVQAIATGDSSSLDTAASVEPAAGGGGELFGIVPIISWLLDRLDFISESHAAEPEQTAARAESPRLEQLWAQLRIAREAEVLRVAKTFEAVMADIVAFLEDMLAGGGGSRADLAQAKAVYLEAQLEVKEAEYRHLLAIDAHQDTFGERLLKAAVPDWRDEPPRGFDAIRTAVPADRHDTARRYGRQRVFAEETSKLLETLVGLATEVRDAYVEQFEIAQRTLLEVLGAERVLFQTRVRLVQRQVELMSAEAWLLDATGKLKADYIRRPGWQ